MDPRDDLPRVSIDSLSEWRRTKENYTNATIAIMDRKLAELNMTEHRDLLLQHTNQVNLLLVSDSLRVFASRVDTSVAVYFKDIDRKSVV